MTCECLAKCGRWLRANESFNNAPLFEDVEGGDSGDAKALGCALVFVYVQFGDDGASGKFLRELVDDWGDSAAGAAPGCPEIDEDGQRAGADELVEGGVV